MVRDVSRSPSGVYQACFLPLGYNNTRSSKASAQKENIDFSIQIINKNTEKNARRGSLTPDGNHTVKRVQY